MPSQIDSSYPREGNAYTANVRAQFETARIEISDLQTAVMSMQSQIESLIADNTRLLARQQAAQSQITANPPDTASVDFVTAGLDISFIPSGSSRGYVTAEGALGNTANAGTSYFQLIYGAGAPPAAGTPITGTNGTLVGALVSISTSKPGESRPFSATALLSGLVLNDNYWIGGAYRCDSGSAILSEITVTAFELLDPLTP